jgi:hypothetical protein
MNQKNDCKFLFLLELPINKESRFTKLEKMLRSLSEKLLLVMFRRVKHEVLKIEKSVFAKKL